LLFRIKREEELLKIRGGKREILNKTIWIPVVLGFGTMALLYIIGFVADINILEFKVSSSRTTFSLLPIAVGLLVTYISERIMKSKN
jgi:hypothetical protein